MSTSGMRTRGRRRGESRAAAAAAKVEEARYELSKAQNDLGQLGDINARRRAAEAELYDAELDLSYCYVRAPFDSYVTNLNIAAGQYANQGVEVFALVDDRTWYVMANFREDFLASIAPGMEADVYLMSYPRQKFHGRVQGIGWALYQKDGATVGVLPAIEPTLNWVRLAQRFPVRILLEDADPAPAAAYVTQAEEVSGVTQATILAQEDDSFLVRHLGRPGTPRPDVSGIGNAKPVR